MKEENINKRRQWIISSLVFVAIAFFGIILLMFKFQIGDITIAADSLNAIIVRIVFVAIAIAGASFSAKQYLKQKKLADEYAYKLVLAKSIIAFAKEIKKHSEDKVAEYLTNVLEEINRSPVKSSKEDNESITPKNLMVFEKIFEVINKK